MSNQLKFNLVISEFDEVLGPLPKFSYPEINEEFGLQIAMRSINLLSGLDASNLKSLAFLPFPKEEKKGLIRNIEWYDSKLRGGSALGSLTLIINESDDLIFYKYIKDIEILFDEASDIIVKLKTYKANNEKIFEELKLIHAKFSTRLNDLNRQEIGFEVESEPFPEEPFESEKDEFLYKIVVCGDPACGKTSIVLKFTESAFRRTYLPTIGVNMTKKEILIENKRISLVLWDIAGQMKFQTMRRHFYDGARGIILLFDTTRRKTFENISYWFQDIKNALKRENDLVSFLCGNKIDLMEEREVNSEEAMELSKKLNIEYFETSALTGKNIDHVFYNLAKKIIDSFE